MQTELFEAKLILVKNIIENMNCDNYECLVRYFFSPKKNWFVDFLFYLKVFSGQTKIK